MHLPTQERAGISEDLNGRVVQDEVQEVVVGHRGRLVRALLIIFRILAFILKDKRNHWKVLSRVTLFFSCLRRIALPAVLRTDCEEGEVGKVWRQGDQVGGYRNNPGKG